MEAIEVVVTWKIVTRKHKQRQLIGSIESHCFEELIKNCEDLDYVEKLLFMAHTNYLGRLLEACNATIISFHFADLCRDIQQNKRLNDRYVKSLNVRSFMRKVPPVVIANQG